MKGLHVVVAHNEYRSAFPSGENSAVRDDVAELRARGVTVSTILPSSDQIADMALLRRAAVAVGPIYARDALKQLREINRRRRVDVLHLHNAFPMISPAIILQARALGVPVVHSVHKLSPHLHQRCPPS